MIESVVHCSAKSQSKEGTRLNELQVTASGFCVCFLTPIDSHITLEMAFSNFAQKNALQGCVETRQKKLTEAVKGRPLERE